MDIKAVRCYRDGLRYQSRHFHGYPGHLARIGDIQLGRVIFRVRETLAAKDTGDPHYAPSSTRPLRSFPSGRRYTR